MKTYILGGGPAGLALLDGLVDEGHSDVVLIEASDQLGGLAKSLDWSANGSHDLGPHKLFTLDPALMKRVMGLLPEDAWLEREKVSSIYMNGHYLPYPPSPFSLANVFGLAKFFKMCFGYGMKMLTGPFRFSQPKTFEEDLVGRMGTPLYEVLFKPIALKLWGDPKNLDVKLSKGRVQTPSILEIFARLLKIKKTSEFEALTFHYPKGGLQRIWNRIEEKAQAKQCRVLKKTRVTKIQASPSSVDEIHCTSENGTEVFKIEAGDQVFSTLPLGLLTQLMDGGLSPKARELIHRSVVLNDLYLVFLKLDVKNLFDESWVFIPDPQVAFHRISEQNSFDPGMTPDGTIVCCEIMDNEMRDIDKKSDQELIDASIAGIKKMGKEGFQVKDSYIQKLPKSYPVFRPGFEKDLTEILAEADNLKNFKTIGRQGAFNYIGTLDAMDIGYGTARWIGKPNNWQQERDRTRHYPVLD